MAEPINLNKARKARAKTAGQTEAAENRIRFGRAKGEKAIAKLDAERVRRDLDGKKRD
ncbi:DUF4169 family protein [Phenylobacterium sp.]|uniref:DUF4169 family protein n=1 Tax=Phenylobacterium sp. TaxID=1871053 RepID=UPI0025EECC99|nr:DUF4169 family protein [Phenylobacterium sp.]